MTNDELRDNLFQQLALCTTGLRDAQRMLNAAVRETKLTTDEGEQFIIAIESGTAFGNELIRLGAMLRPDLDLTA
ncbi:MAG TPA: hypothetical protein PK402_09900 [Tepidisphaeraceae bacterium]|nr:hypothetical protein [Tepidisphaeraceae bacterium]